MVDGSKHCWNLNDSTFSIFIDHCEDNWLTKKDSVLDKLILKTVDTLTADDKYSLLNKDSLMQPI